jgi:hypothetical protein
MRAISAVIWRICSAPGAWAAARKASAAMQSQSRKEMGAVLLF